MPQSLAKITVHLVFSTKNRQDIIRPEWQERLWSVMAAIAERHRIVPLAIGGVENHVHLLLSLPGPVSVSQAAQWIKGASSHWLHETRDDAEGFAWQEGYAAFSVGIRGLDRRRQYIRGQKEHHSTTSYEDEIRGFLRDHDVEYDERYVFG